MARARGARISRARSPRISRVRRSLPPRSLLSGDRLRHPHAARRLYRHRLRRRPVFLSGRGLVSAFGRGLRRGPAAGRDRCPGPAAWLYDGHCGRNAVLLRQRHLLRRHARGLCGRAAAGGSGGAGEHRGAAAAGHLVLLRVGAALLPLRQPMPGGLARRAGHSAERPPTLKGSSALDALAAKIAASRYDGVAIVGHADRATISLAKVSMRSEPVTTKADCAGARARVRRLASGSRIAQWFKRVIVEQHRHVEGLVAALDQEGNGTGHVLEWLQCLGAFHGRSVYSEQLVARTDARARRGSGRVLDDHRRIEREAEPVRLSLSRGRETGRRDGGEKKSCRFHGRIPRSISIGLTAFRAFTSPTATNATGTTTRAKPPATMPIAASDAIARAVARASRNRRARGRASGAREVGIDRATVRQIALALPAAGHALAWHVEMEAAAHALPVGAPQVREDPARVQRRAAEGRHLLLGGEVAHAAVPAVPLGLDLGARLLARDLQIIAGEDRAVGERRRHPPARAAAVIALPREGDGLVSRRGVAAAAAHAGTGTERNAGADQQRPKRGALHGKSFEHCDGSFLVTS